MEVSIDEIKAREILDPGGLPALEAEVILEDGTYGAAQVSGSDAAGCRRPDPGTPLSKTHVSEAVSIINGEVSNLLCGANSTGQSDIDEQLRQIGELASFASFAVSEACAKAAANALSLPLYRYLGGINAKTLPLPQINAIDTPYADCKGLLLQPSGAASLTEGAAVSADILQVLKEELRASGAPVLTGEYGGIVTGLQNMEDNIGLLCGVIEKAGFIPGEDAEIILSVCAEENYIDNKYYFKNSRSPRSAKEQALRLCELCESYPVAVIEDPFSKNDPEGWQELQETIGNYVVISGDFGSDPSLIREAAKDRWAGCSIVRPEAAGTVTGIFEALSAPGFAGWQNVLGRSCSTEDTFIADMSVAANTGIIRAGSMARTDGVAVLNQLLRIEEELDINAVFGTEAE